MGTSQCAEVKDQSTKIFTVQHNAYCLCRPSAGSHEISAYRPPEKCGMQSGHRFDPRDHTDQMYGLYVTSAKSINLHFVRIVICA